MNEVCAVPLERSACQEAIVPDFYNPSRPDPGTVLVAGLIQSSQLQVHESRDNHEGPVLKIQPRLSIHTVHSRFPETKAKIADKSLQYCQVEATHCGQGAHIKKGKGTTATTRQTSKHSYTGCSKSHLGKRFSDEIMLNNKSTEDLAKQGERFLQSSFC